MTDHTKDAPPDVPASPLPGSGAGGAPSTPGSGPEELPLAKREELAEGEQSVQDKSLPAPLRGWRGPPGSAGRPRGVRNGEGKGGYNPNKVHWWYERLADWMIGNPHLTMKDAARHFDKSYAWVLQLKNSDTFQRYWRERSGITSGECIGAVKSKAFAASEAALDLLNDRLEQVPESFTTAGLLDVVDTTMKRFGYSEGARSAPAVSVNIGLVSPGELQAARERMRYREGNEGTLVEIPPSTSDGGGE